MKPEAAPELSSEALARFDELVELPPEARVDRLSSIGASNPGLRLAIEELLAADAQADMRLARFDRAIGAAANGAGPAPDADPAKMIGRTVSHFRVTGLLAYGGMGAVYRATDTALQRTIALKFPLPAQHVDVRSRERFLHEARVVGGLDHPNLCGIYEIGETEDGFVFFAMPLYPGETLKARLAREGALPVADVVDIAEQISQGLSAAHRAGVVHRDLKPANVMLLPDGTVKLLDFGLAKARDLGLTQPQMMLGTAAYMAPEQVLENPVDARADLWALGVMLYEMLAGKRPFDGGHEISVAHAIVHREPVSLSSLRSDLGSDIEALVTALLEKDPAQRCQSVETAISALDAIERGERSPLHPAHERTLASRVRARVSTRYAALAAGMLVVLALSGWFVTRAVGSAPEPRRIAVLPFSAQEITGLPFTDPSEAGGEDYIGVALGDALNTELARISALVLPSFRSVLIFAGAKQPLPEAAEALGVAAIVGGRLQRTGDRLNGEVRIFDAKDKRYVWTRRYSNATALEVEREVLQAVIDELRVPLTRVEQARLEGSHTKDAAAYDLFLQARYLQVQALARGSTDVRRDDNIRRAQALLAQATSRDPGFARAHAWLALAHMTSAWSYDNSEVRREQGRVEAEIASRLLPGLYEVHDALTSYWIIGGDREKAVEEAERAASASPGHGERYVILANAYRDVGRWDDATATFENAMRLDPYNSFAFHYASVAYFHAHRVEEGLRALNRAIELRPYDHSLALQRGYSYLNWTGNADTLAAIASRLPAGWDTSGVATRARYTALRAQRRYADAVAMLDRSGYEMGGVYTNPHPRALMRAQMLDALGERMAARADYEHARAVLADSIATNADHPGLRLLLALAYAGLDMKREALSEANHALETVSPRRSSVAAGHMGLAVEVFGRAGELDKAFELLELLFTMHAGRETSVPYLRVWPGFDPLREDPRFEQLLARFAPS
ncbi:hypothetical protein BH23GEM2_BH23GEM2_06140 [soil metagenome]